jgi:hypothetical protein
MANASSTLFVAKQRKNSLSIQLVSQRADGTHIHDILKFQASAFSLLNTAFVNTITFHIQICAMKFSENGSTHF